MSSGAPPSGDDEAPRKTGDAEDDETAPRKTGDADEPALTPAEAKELAELEAEVARLEREAKLYREATTRAEAFEAMIAGVKAAQPSDPFSSNYAGPPNPYHRPPKTQSASCCLIS